MNTESENGVLDLRDKKFTQVTNIVLEDSLFIKKAASKMVYVILCYHADNTTKKSFPSVKTLARECGCSENTVRTSIALLKEHRLIDVIERKSHESGQLSNMYVLLNPPDEYTEKVRAEVARLRAWVQN